MLNSGEFRTWKKLEKRKVSFLSGQARSGQVMLGFLYWKALCGSISDSFYSHFCQFSHSFICSFSSSKILSYEFFPYIQAKFFLFRSVSTLDKSLFCRFSTFFPQFSTLQCHLDISFSSFKGVLPIFYCWNLVQKWFQKLCKFSHIICFLGQIGSYQIRSGLVRSD